MIELIKSDTFDRWLGNLGDIRAKTRIAARLDRLAMGNPGDIKSVGEGVCEMRIDYGPGYRIYYTRRGSLVVLLLCGGAKSSQVRDIAQAKAIAAQLKEE